MNRTTFLSYVCFVSTCRWNVLEINCFLRAADFKWILDSLHLALVRHITCILYMVAWKLTTTFQIEFIGLFDWLNVEWSQQWKRCFWCHKRVNDLVLVDGLSCMMIERNVHEDVKLWFWLISIDGNIIHPW